MRLSTAVGMLLVLAMAGVADADRDMCVRGAPYRGAPIDLDVKNADLHDVYRLLSDVGRINIVVSDKVQGKVTLRLKRVPWDQVACTVAATHRLTVTVSGNVALVVPQERGG